MIHKRPSARHPGRLTPGICSRFRCQALYGRAMRSARGEEMIHTSVHRHATLGGVLGVFAFAFAVTSLWIAAPAKAVPAYARQTGQQCAMCHVGLPELTPFGREFKLNGYVQGGGADTWIPPLSVMLQPSFTNTGSAQPPGSVPSHIGL